MVDRDHERMQNEPVRRPGPVAIRSLRSPLVADDDDRRGPTSLRHTPPDLGAGVVLRPRLIEPLRGRFDRRLTVLVAGPGFGKTTLLAQAVHENRVERRGIDAWIRLTVADQDPEHLCAGLGRSVSAGEQAAMDVDRVVDRIWRAAPEDLALVIDDAHLLGDAHPAWEVLGDLLERMPTNGHLVVAGRTPVALPVGRLVAEDAALVVDEAALTFTAAELDDFAVERGLDGALADELPPWPALAVLATAVGRRGAEAFLWDEAFAALEPDRTRLLALAAPFEVVDDTLLAAIDPDGPWTASSLIAGIPLVQSDGRGTVRFHALLAAAVRDRVDPVDRAETLAHAAERLIAADAPMAGAEAAAIAGADHLLHRAICQVTAGPIASVSVPDIISLYERLPGHLRTAAIGYYLDAARHWASGAREAIGRFERAAALARAEGDRAIEALATWRSTQQRYLDDPTALRIEPAMVELAGTGVALSRSTPAFIESVLAQHRGDIDGAVAALDHLDDSDPDQRRATVAVRMLDLGRPEASPATMETLFEPRADPLVSACSLWLRGDVSPEDAWSIGAILPAASDRRGALHDQVAVNSIMAVVASAVGALDDATRLLDRARAASELVGRQVALHLAMAQAIVALSTHDETEATHRLRSALELLPIDGWVGRGHLIGLAPLRALLPTETASLDRLAFGPALTTTVAAGRALADLRAKGDARPATALPWTSPNVLRCLVPPPLLAELALAASDERAPGAAEVAERIANRRRWAQRVADHPNGDQRRRAETWLATLPARPPYDVCIRTFGDLDISRTDGQPVDRSRLSRERVRQIVGQLVVNRSVLRAELAAQMWPDLPAAKALDNLRVNLRHLQAALQPERGNDPPWFVQVEGETITLAADGVDVDAIRFDEHIRRATDAEAQGIPSLALAEYRAAVDLATGGPFLAGIDDVAVDAERIRYGSLAHAARCRVGELVLAKGEPEAAMRDAAHALRSDPSSERAHRLFIRCHLAVGSTDAARAVARRLLDQLAADSLAPEDETVALLHRIGMPVTP